MVTGGGTGIGKAIATELALLGATVILAARNAERVAETAKVLNAMLPSPTVASIRVDIRDDAMVNSVMKTLTEQHGRVDVLVNNGGGQFASPAAAIRPKGWRAVVDTNLNGTWFMCQALYANTPAAKRAGMCIVNVTADFFNGFPGMAHTGAARAAVDNLTKTLAREWGPEGVRVNSVAPGIILSSGVHNYPAEYRNKFFTSGESVPLGRPGSESEIASAVVFLSSPAARYVTGATLRVDGGGSLSKTDFIDEELMSDFRSMEGGLDAGARKALTAQACPPFHLTSGLEEEFEQRKSLKSSCSPPPSKL